MVATEVHHLRRKMLAKWREHAKEAALMELVKLAGNPLIDAEWRDINLEEIRLRIEGTKKK